MARLEQQERVHEGNPESTRRPIVDPELEEYALKHSQPEPDLLSRLSDETASTMPIPEMLGGKLEGELLKLLVQTARARRVLEIGTFTGYSALCMAEGLPEDGSLTTLEIDADSAAVASRYFQESPHGHKIDLRLGPAQDTLQELQGPFDLVFIDADKENYPNYYEYAVQNTQAGGLVVVDNALWSGRVLNPIGARTRTIDEMNQRIVADDRVENVLLPVGDGLQVVRKKNEA